MNLHAVVDMGSNGIRFSITDLSDTARIMPALYQDRVGISLYDAQWKTGTQQPIPDQVTKDVIRSLLRFKSTCRDFGVPESNVRILATEATRVAKNSQQYRDAIKSATGWEVEMLPKEEEGRVGANGVASSFPSVKGLMMDLGGGSTQITWLISEHGDVRMSDAGSVSMPYGAAALIRRLNEANQAGPQALNTLSSEIITNLEHAVQQIAIPKEILQTAKTEEGLTLYLSGGGFRGWGFVVMSEHRVSPYPIPIINGFQTTFKSFVNTKEVQNAAAGSEEIFRVSERRASQVPAVALLVRCLLKTLPAIKTVKFAQGGVREGSLYMTLPKEVRAQHPLEVATRPYSSQSTSLILRLIKHSDPGDGNHHTRRKPSAIGDAQLTALAQSLFIHNNLAKDIQAASALRSTTTGHLASMHGADHSDRAVLALMLCERWGGTGALSPSDTKFHGRLVELVGPTTAWWCYYFGRVGALIGNIYPAGVVHEADNKLKIHTDWFHKVDEDKVDIIMDFGHDEQDSLQSAGVGKALDKIIKLSKKKKWPVPGEGGRKIRLDVRKNGERVDLDADSEEHTNGDDD